MTDETLSLTEKRRANKSKNLLCRQINKEVRRKCAEAKNHWINGTKLKELTLAITKEKMTSSKQYQRKRAAPKQTT